MLFWYVTLTRYKLLVSKCSSNVNNVKDRALVNNEIIQCLELFIVHAVLVKMHLELL